MVELLTAYSHSAQATELRLCHIEILTNPVRAPRTSAKRPRCLAECLDDCRTAGLLTASCAGVTAAGFTAAHGGSHGCPTPVLRTLTLVLGAWTEAM